MRVNRDAKELLANIVTAIEIDREKKLSALQNLNNGRGTDGDLLIAAENGLEDTNTSNDAEDNTLTIENSEIVDDLDEMDIAIASDSEEESDSDLDGDFDEEDEDYELSSGTESDEDDDLGFDLDDEDDDYDLDPDEEDDELEDVDEEDDSDFDDEFEDIDEEDESDYDEEDDESEGVDEEDDLDFSEEDDFEDSAEGEDDESEDAALDDEDLDFEEDDESEDEELDLEEDEEDIDPEEDLEDEDDDSLSDESADFWAEDDGDAAIEELVIDKKEPTSKGGSRKDADNTAKNKDKRVRPNTRPPNTVIQQPVQNNVLTKEEVKRVEVPNKITTDNSELKNVNSVVYYVEGISVKDFLKRNPTIRVETEVLKYFTQKQLEEAVKRQGVLRRKGKLLI